MGVVFLNLSKQRGLAPIGKGKKASKNVLSSNMNFGRAVEDIVENLCKKSFLADFTVRSPKYYKLGGQEKEVADLLVLFGDTMIAIQVKTKKVGPASLLDSSVENERVSRTIEAALLQFRSLVEAADVARRKSFINGRGVEVAFDPKRIKDIVLIVVFAPIWEGKIENAPAFLLEGSCHANSPVPVHLFTIQQFSTLLTMMNTLPDFLLFLDARHLLHSQRLVSVKTDPIDEWAFITFERKNLSSVLETRQFVDLIGVSKRHLPSVEQMERREKPSYFIDSLIEKLYISIGTGSEIDAKSCLSSAPNSREGYRFVVPKLAGLNRRERSRLVEFLMRCAMQCEDQSVSFRAVKFKDESEEAYLLFASQVPQDERRIALRNVMLATGFKCKVKTVVGIAVGRDWPDDPSCDVMAMDTSEVKANANILQFIQSGMKERRGTKRR